MTFIYCALQVTDLPILKAMLFQDTLDIADRSSFICRMRFTFNRQGSAALAVIAKNCVERFGATAIMIELKAFRKVAENGSVRVSEFFNVGCSCCEGVDNS